VGVARYEDDDDVVVVLWRESSVSRCWMTLSLAKEVSERDGDLSSLRVRVC